MLSYVNTMLTYRPFYDQTPYWLELDCYIYKILHKKIFYTEGGFLKWLQTRWEIKVFFKWKNAKENFSGGITRKKFHGGGGSFHRGWDCPEGLFSRWRSILHLRNKVLSINESPMRGRHFYGGGARFTGIIWNKMRNKKNKLFQLKVRSNIKPQKRVEDIPHMSTTHPPRCIAISTESWTVCTKLFKNSFWNTRAV